ncbi:MAG: type II secretion system F family protein [Deltaproteobacteria bacterium]|nr:MAG: type II secretion system F family protein [Deltaproteobacteria bacterium]
MEKSPPYRALISLSRYINTLNPNERLSGYYSSLRKKLISAGSPGALTPEEFLVLRELAAVTFMLIALILAGVGNLAVPILALVLGFFYPNLWLRDRVKKRQQSIFRGLPFSLDLLTLSVEAGLDFASAVNKLVEKSAEGPLREEMFQVVQEMKMGKTRAQALRDMAERVQLPELSALVSNLIQAEELGTGLGPMLRIQSTQFRNKRFQRAEKLAMEAPVKMTFPLLFIFVSVFLLLFGSLLLDVLKGGVF